jgi:hypothetical protein
MLCFLKQQLATLTALAKDGKLFASPGVLLFKVLLSPL